MQLKQIFTTLSGETDAHGIADGFLRRGWVFRGQLDVPEDGGQVSGRSETRGFHASGSGWCKQVRKELHTAQFWHEKSPRNCSRKQNNVWGSILQEESLTSDLNDIGVGRRSLRDIGSDRGAETYDYLLAQVI